MENWLKRATKFWKNLSALVVYELYDNWWVSILQHSACPDTFYNMYRINIMWRNKTLAGFRSESRRWFGSCWRLGVVTAIVSGMCNFHKNSFYERRWDYSSRSRWRIKERCKLYAMQTSPNYFRSSGTRMNGTRRNLGTQSLEEEPERINNCNSWKRKTNIQGRLRKPFKSQDKPEGRNHVLEWSRQVLPLV